MEKLNELLQLKYENKEGGISFLTLVELRLRYQEFNIFCYSLSLNELKGISESLIDVRPLAVRRIHELKDEHEDILNIIDAFHLIEDAINEFEELIKQQQSKLRYYLIEHVGTIFDGKSKIDNSKVVDSLMGLTEPVFHFNRMSAVQLSNFNTKLANNITLETLIYKYVSDNLSQFVD